MAAAAASAEAVADDPTPVTRAAWPTRRSEATRAGGKAGTSPATGGNAVSEFSRRLETCKHTQPTDDRALLQVPRDGTAADDTSLARIDRSVDAKG